MIRHLKILMAAVVALAALGASGGSIAQAGQFHCSAEPCVGLFKADGLGKTSHHVLIIENSLATESVSFTCEFMEGITTQSKKTKSEGITFGLSYSLCTVNGSLGVTVDMNGCNFFFTGSGGVAITNCLNEAHRIEITVSGCTFNIPEQTRTGIQFHNVGTTPNREITVEANVRSIQVTASGTTANCKINPSQTLTGTYTTGNTIVTGETTLGGAMADAWFE